MEKLQIGYTKLLYTDVDFQFLDQFTGLKNGSLWKDIEAAVDDAVYNVVYAQHLAYLNVSRTRLKKARLRGYNLEDRANEFAYQDINRGLYIIGLAENFEVQGNDADTNDLPRGLLEAVEQCWSQLYLIPGCHKPENMVVKKRLRQANKWIKAAAFGFSEQMVRAA